MCTFCSIKKNPGAFLFLICIILISRSCSFEKKKLMSYMMNFHLDKDLGVVYLNAYPVNA